MTKGLVTIFGGSGFIGRYAARELVKKGWRVRVACRRVNLAGEVRLAGAPGWVDIAQANIRDRASIERALTGRPDGLHVQHESHPFQNADCPMQKQRH